MGQHAGLWLVGGAAGAALDRRRAARWRRATATVAAAYLANQAVKLVVRRPRPRLRDLPQLVANPTQLSFPSAHAASSVAAARAYAGLIPRPLLWALASTLSLSRVYLGVHYPSDVAAGAALGALVGRAAR